MSDQVSGEPPPLDEPEMDEPASGAAPAAAGLPTAVEKASTTKAPIPATELLRVDAGDVAATTVTMEKSGAEAITAERLTMTNSGARTVEAKSAQVERSGVLWLKSDYAVLHESSAVSVAAGEVRLAKGKALVVVADRATVEPGTRILVYAGPVGDGVRPALDATGAAAFGAALVLLGALLRRLMR